MIMSRHTANQGQEGTFCKRTRARARMQQTHPMVTSSHMIPATTAWPFTEVQRKRKLREKEREKDNVSNPYGNTCHNNNNSRPSLHNYNAFTLAIWINHVFSKTCSTFSTRPLL
eukprot:scpid109413/ scgid13021/ 